MQFLWYIGYFVLMFGVFTFLDSTRKRGMTERDVVLTIANALTWTVMLSIKNIWLFMVGGILAVMINSYFVSKLYPTLNTKYFMRRKKDAVQCTVRREEKGSKASIPEDKDRDIAENRR